MDNSARTLHSITHTTTQGSNSIPSSSVTLGYNPSAMTAQPQNILPSSTNPTQQQQKHNQTTSSTESADTAPPPPAAAAEIYPHQVTGSGGPLATAPFLRDFSLVAEAAKRAQMSVVLRDLESVTL
ncbi:hypothetical protein CNMCM5793_006434 [Aspergillus hiratsukae]|uniref:Uncharacterized protein n=1 Tax=Aspergillus hiratsukae TaxID=1194566 RepID=A0A8H6PI62_9EURO|nr:hypothetical protein CNMCM5793_006434 [Aspergillus hiratsukae]KAF7174295.1 hypothetical protein CNMCM6106_008504 [Aspergillus hiratsukae]